MPVLKITLRPSRILFAILVAAHGGVIAVVAIMSMPLWLELIAITTLAVNLVVELRRTALLRTPNSVVAIEIGSDDTLSIQTRRGNWISECEVLESTYVAAFLAIVNLREPEMGAVRHVVLLPDSIEAEDFRRLRVWLRWKRNALPA